MGDPIERPVRRRPAFLFLLLVLAVTLSQAVAQKKITYDGVAEIGVQQEYNANYAQVFSRAKLEYKVRLGRFIETEIDVRARSDRSRVELKELSTELRYWSTFRLVIGTLKKRFGVEQLSGREKLATVERSLVYEFMAPFGYVSRDLGIQDVRKPNKRNRRTELYFGLHLNNSNMLTLFTRYGRRLRGGATRVGFGALYERFRGETFFDVFAFSADFRQRLPLGAAVFELFYGREPLATQLRKFAGRPSFAYFAAAKAQWTIPFRLKRRYLYRLEPVLLYTFLLPETDRSRIQRQQLLLGINWYVEKDFRVMLNADLRASNNAVSPGEHSLVGTRFTLQLQQQW